MSSRFRSDLTVVPSVLIKIGRSGLSTTVGWSSSTRNFPDALSLRQIGDARFSGPLPTDRFLIPGTRKDFGGGKLEDMTSPGLTGFKELLVATRIREQEIKVERKKAKRQLFWARTTRLLAKASLATLASPSLRNRTDRAVSIRKTELDILDANLAATKIAVNFDMESEIAEPQRRFQAAADLLGQTHRIWSIQTEQRIDRVKARSWAGTVVARIPTVVRRQFASLVDTADSPPAITVRKGLSTAYFYPGFVLVDGGQNDDFAVIDFTELNIACEMSNFTEAESVPRDARLIGTTWAKANKDGSRDRRFKDNRELPILCYGSIHLTSGGGMNEVLMASNAEACAGFAAAANNLKKALTAGRRSRALESRHLLGKNR